MSEVFSAPAAQSCPVSVQRLDCYRLAVEFASIAPAFVPRGHAALRDQLERATTSVLLSFAEGHGRWQPREKSHFYSIAIGSLQESVAVIDLLQARGLASEHACERARVLAGRVGQMLSAMIAAVGRRRTMVG